MFRLNPKVDFAFKKIFGSEENRDILMSFINSIMSKDKKSINIELKTPYTFSHYQNGKMSTLDVEAQDENGTWYDIVIYIAEQNYYFKRSLYHWAKAYSEQNPSGDNNGKLKKTISINILYFDYLDEEEYYNVYDIYNRKSMKFFMDDFEMYFIELGKFKKSLKDLTTILDFWTAFLSKSYEMDKSNIPNKFKANKEIEKALEQLERTYLDKEEAEVYENQLKTVRDYYVQMETAEMKGRMQGKIIGYIQGLYLYSDYKIEDATSKAEELLSKITSIYKLEKIYREIFEAKSIEEVEDIFKKYI